MVGLFMFMIVKLSSKSCFIWIRFLLSIPRRTSIRVKVEIAPGWKLLWRSMLMIMPLSRRFMRI